MRRRQRPATPEVAGPPASVSTTDKLLLGVALLAGIAVTAAGEWQLARQVGIAPGVAPLLPVAIDVYVAAAVRAGRGGDIAAALAMMGGAQVGAHLLATGHISASVALVAAVSLVAPVVIWRVHALARRGTPAVSTPVTGLTPPVVNVSRGTQPPLKAPVYKRPTPVGQLPRQGVVSAAQQARQQVLTVPVSPEPEEPPQGPERSPSEEVVRALYDQLGNKRPGTSHIRRALADAGLPSSDGTCREVRKRVEMREPKLKDLAPAEAN